MKPGAEPHLPLLASNTIFYVIGLILANALTFISFPILARGLSTHDFGLLDLFASFSILITIIMAFGIDSSVGRYFHEYDDNDKRKKIVLEAFVIQSFIIVGLGSILYLMADQFIIYISQDYCLVTLLRLSIMQAVFQAILNFTLSLLK